MAIRIDQFEDIEFEVPAGKDKFVTISLPPMDCWSPAQVKSINEGLAELRTADVLNGVARQVAERELEALQKQTDPDEAAVSEALAGPVTDYRTAFFISSAASQGVWTTTRNSSGWKNWTRIDIGGGSTPSVQQVSISADYFPDPTAPLEADTSRVVMWGDSLTQAGGVRTRLTELQTEVEFVNRGVSYQTALQIAARQGEDGDRFPRGGCYTRIGVSSRDHYFRVGTKWSSDFDHRHYSRYCRYPFQHYRNRQLHLYS